MKNKVIVSIIIVHYHAKEVLLNCIESVVRSKHKTPYEIIVVDNDEKKVIDKDLKKLFPNVIYVKSSGNYGFGAAVNMGVKVAKGEYLGFFNPDTLVLGSAIDNLYKFTKNTKKAGIVSAVVKNEKKMLQEKQGAGKLTPLNAVINYSIFSKIFYRTPLSDSYWIYSHNVGNYKHSYSVPLGWAILKKSIYEEVGGFDERFFLYYEDVDICKRIEEAGYRNYVYSGAEFIHLGGKGGTEAVKNINYVYKHSGFLYFKKHYGLVTAYITTALLEISKVKILMGATLSLATFLLFYQLESLISFFGDQGWFYLSARDMLLTGNIPLVGIASSHPWLHQGALWTYILSAIFAISNFNPIAPGYFTAGVGVLTVLLMYWVGKRMFSSAVGIIAAFLYTTSPLVIIHARMPYHTSLIPVTVLLYVYVLYKWLTGKLLFFPLAILLLAILYNFQISTTPFLTVLAVCLLYGIWKKKAFVAGLFNKKIIGLSFFAWVIPMLPMLIYDFNNGFPQTVKFVLWIGYRFARLFGFPSIHVDAVFEPLAPFLPFTITKIQHLVFLPNNIIAGVLLFGAFSLLSYKLYSHLREKKSNLSLLSLYLCFTIPFISYLAIQTTSEAYWPMFFPTAILMLSVAASYIMRSKLLKIIIVFVIIFVGSFNAYTLIKENYLMNEREFGYPFSERLRAAEIIVNKAQGREYNIQGLGSGSKFESFTMPYEYLTWWLGNESSKEKQNLLFKIHERENGIVIEEIIK